MPEFRYITVCECIENNGRRHLANAIRYAQRGLFAYAEGSMRKAWKNYMRVAALREFGFE